MKNNIPFEDKLKYYRDRVTKALKNAIMETTLPNSILQEAMLYSTLNGGKRLRPILTYSVAEAFGAHADQLDFVAAAIECTHCFSLIHDDLPAMDDDSLRRGKPTCHIVFNEAQAILAADALQTLAFELLASNKNSSLSAAHHLKLIQLLATASGGEGMVAGQSLDLLAEGKHISIPELDQIHSLKTGALIKASVMMGAIAANREDKPTLNALALFADNIGLAFQLQDDLLDITGSRQKIGKNTQQDIKQNKSTYATLHGTEKTKEKIEALTASAITLLDSLNADTTFLKTLCLALLSRES